MMLASATLNNVQVEIFQLRQINNEHQRIAKCTHNCSITNFQHKIKHQLRLHANTNLDQHMLKMRLQHVCEHNKKH